MPLIDKPSLHICFLFILFLYPLFVSTFWVRAHDAKLFMVVILKVHTVFYLFHAHASLTTVFMMGWFLQKVAVNLWYRIINEYAFLERFWFQCSLDYGYILRFRLPFATIVTFTDVTTGRLSKHLHTLGPPWIFIVMLRCTHCVSNFCSGYC